MVIRFAPVFFFGLTAFKILYDNRSFYIDMSIADGGTVAVLALMTRIDSGEYPQLLIGLMLSVLLLGVLLGGAVIIGLFALRRSGASAFTRESARSV